MESLEVKIVVGELHIKRETPKEMNLKEGEEIFELNLRQEIPQEVVDWFKSL